MQSEKPWKYKLQHDPTQPPSKRRCEEASNERVGVLLADQLPGSAGRSEACLPSLALRAPAPHNLKVLRQNRKTKEEEKN